MPSPIIDGKTVVGYAPTTPTITIGLSTTLTNDIILVFVSATVPSASGAVHAVSVSAPGLMFVPRWAIQQGQPNAFTPYQICNECWWAASPSVLSSVTIT